VNRGFSLVELIFALLILQVGVLATAGMFLISQQSLRRAELTLRGVLEAGWVADSLVMMGAVGSGKTSPLWGELLWSPVSTPVQGLRVSAWVPLRGTPWRQFWHFHRWKPPFRPGPTPWRSRKGGEGDRSGKRDFGVGGPPGPFPSLRGGSGRVEHSGPFSGGRDECGPPG
jgi:hypothetical protein